MKTIHYIAWIFLVGCLVQLNASATNVSDQKLANNIAAILKKHYPKSIVQSNAIVIARYANPGSSDYESLRMNLIRAFSTADPDLKWLGWQSGKQVLLQKLASDIAYLTYGKTASKTGAVLTATVTDMNDMARNAVDAAQLANQATQSALIAAQTASESVPSTNGNGPPALPTAPVATQQALTQAKTAADAAQSALTQTQQKAAQVQADIQALQEIGAQNFETGDASKTNNIYGQLTIWTGAKLSNPYTISSNKLSSGGTSSDGYIELNYSSRYVLREGDDATDIRWSGWGEETKEDDAIHFVNNPLSHMPDIDTRFGYLFRGSSAPTNFTASTIAGTADFYADTSIGVPLARYGSSGDDLNKFKMQVTLDLSGGFATDKNHLQLHPTAFAGLGWQGSFAISTNTQAYWIGRAGYAFIDQPSLLPGTNIVQLNSLQMPVYSFQGAPAIGVIVVYPLTSAISFQAGANAYFTSRQPASWNATVGVTLDLSKFFKGLTQ